MDLTTHGKDMLKSFLFNVSGLSGLFTLADREAECIKYIKNTVGCKKVLVSIRIYCSLCLYLISLSILFHLSISVEKEFIKRRG